MPYSFNPLSGLGLDQSIPLDGAGKIPSDYLPSYVDDVVEYANLAAFPATGETGKIYVAIDTGFTYRWSGSVYIQINSLTGTFAANAGTAAAPSISIGTADNGVYAPAEDQVAISTNGTGRLFVDSNGNVGVGTTTPDATIHSWTQSAGAATIAAALQNSSLTAGTEVRLTFSPNTNTISDNRYAWIGAINKTGSTDVELTFATAPGGGPGQERARIDSSGRLLVGTSSARTVEYVPGTAGIPKFQVEGDDGGSSQVLITDTRLDGRNPSLAFAKTRNGAIVAANDILGSVNFFGDDGTDTRTWGGRITCEVDGTPSANDMPGRLVFSTTADGASSPTERMRITQAGYLKASDNGTYELSTGTYHELRTSIATGPAVLAYGNNGSYSGNVLQLGGSRNTTDGSWNFLKCRHNSIDRLNILDSGNVQNANNSYGAISDIKLKENIVDAGSQWDDMKALQVRNYNFKEGQTHTQIGLIAQEVELVSPGLVSESPDRDEEGNDLGTTTKSVNYSVLYMKAVKALQEAMERIEQLEASNADLLARVTALEAS